jgi:toxin ParE1/3/4
MATLIVSPEARDDIATVAVYLREKGGSPVADKYLDRFDKISDLLSHFPGIGTLKPCLGPQTRTTVVAPYVLIYDYDRTSDVVTLLRVVHGRRNITSDLITRR